MSFRENLVCLALISLCGCAATTEAPEKAMYDFDHKQPEPAVEETKKPSSGRQCSKSSLSGTKPVVSALCQQ